MILGKIISFAFCCIHFLCSTMAKYLLVIVKEEKQDELVTAMPDDEYFQGQDLENNEIISLSDPGPGTGQDYCA